MRRRLMVPDSSNVRTLSYDRNRRELEVTFHSDPALVYRYFDVWASDFFDLVEARSVGSHFYRHIRFNRDGSEREFARFRVDQEETS